MISKSKHAAPGYNYISLFVDELNNSDPFELERILVFNSNDPVHFAKFVKQTLGFMQPEFAEKVKKSLLEKL